MANDVGPHSRLNLRTWAALLALGVALWLIIQGFGLLMEVTAVLFGSTLIALAIRPLATALAERHIPRVATVAIVYLLGLGIMTSVGFLLVPIIRTEANNLEQNGVALAQQVDTWLRSLPVVGAQIPTADTFIQDLGQRIQGIAATLLSALTSVGGLALDLLLVAVIGFFLAADRRLGNYILDRWVPAQRRARVDAALTGIRLRLARWVWAQLAIALYFAVSFSLGLTILGVPYSLTIGWVGGLLEVVPYLGGAVALALAIISAATVNPLRVLWVLGLYFVVVEVESHVISPAFYGRITGLHPVVVLVALLIGGKTAGIAGIFFAVPTAVVIAAIVAELGPPEAVEHLRKLREIRT